MSANRKQTYSGVIVIAKEICTAKPATEKRPLILVARLLARRVGQIVLLFLHLIRGKHCSMGMVVRVAAGTRMALLGFVLLLLIVNKLLRKLGVEELLMLMKWRLFRIP